jgi:TatD DNase family protein
MFFDSHCHIDPDLYGGDAGADAVVETARAAGVRWMLTVGSGYGDGSAEKAAAVAARHEGVWASVGMHPHDASALDDAVLERLVALCARPEVVAFGEMGLDFFYDNSPRDVQRDAFRRQIRAALSLDLPIIIHDRDSEGECRQILEEEGAFGGAGVLYHCYAGDVAQMEALVALGAYISVPGTVTFKKSEEGREVARRVPLDRLLIETDAPFLTPEPLRGRRNEPAHVALTGEYVAGLRGMSVEALATATAENAARLLRVTL